MSTALVAGAAPAPPKALSISPSSGSTDGGDTVTIEVTAVDRITQVKVGGVALTGLTVVDSQTLSGTTGAHVAAAGQDVRLVTAYGAESVLDNAFEFIEPPP